MSVTHCHNKRSLNTFDAITQMEQVFQTPLRSRGLTRREFKTRLRQFLSRMSHFPRAQKPQIWTERMQINWLPIQRSRRWNGYEWIPNICYLFQ